MKQRLRKPLALLLTLAMCLSLLPSVAFAAVGDTYTLVKNASELAIGDKVIIAALSADYALGTYANGNNVPAVAVTKSGSDITIPAGVTELTLEEGMISGTFSFNTGDGYLYAASSSSNYLKVEPSQSDNSSWKIETISSTTGEVKVKAQGSNTRSLMRYNPNNPNPSLFGSYADSTTTGTNVVIYKKADGGDPQPITIAVPTAVINLKYTGSELIGVAEGTGYTLTDNTATDVGNYTATATLAEGYEWSDTPKDGTREIPWSIAKAEQPIPTGLSGVAPTSEGGADGKITGVADSMEWKKASDAGTDYASVGIGLTVITGLETGSYHVRLKGDPNHEPGQAATVEVPTFTPANKVATPTATPATGTQVKAGDKITLSCDTANVVISYKFDNNEYATYVEPGITVPALADGITIIIKAKATKEGWTGSEEATFTYTFKEDIPQPGGHVVINQVYGGGGNSGAEYKSDYIELYNPTNAEVDLSNYSVQYTSASGTTWQVTELTGKIGSGKFYLIKEADGAGGTKDLPTPDAIGTIAMSGTAFKVALMDTKTAATGEKPAANLIDFVGAGTANSYEGTAPAPAPSNTKSIGRTNGIDTDNNSADFIQMDPNPRNSKSGDPGPGTVADPAYTGNTTVLSGTKVQFTCATTGAKIEFSKTSAAAADFAEQPADGVEITGNVGVDVKVWVRASKQDMNPSTVKEFTFTIKDPNASNVKNVKEVLALPNPGTTGVPVEVQGELVYRTSYPDGGNDGTVIQSVVDGTTYSLFVYKGVLGDAPYAIGDTVKLTGTYKIYNKLPEIDGYTAEKVSGSTTPSAPAVMTIAQAKSISVNVSDGAIGSYILLKNVTIGATTTDSNGKNPNTAITDSTGTMNIYNAATEGLNVGDVVDIRAVVVVNNSTVQLRTGTPALNGGSPVYIVGDDVRPPVITLPTFLSAAKGQDYIVSVTITDNVGVAEAKLTYTVPGGQAKTVDLVRVGVTNEWKFTIPAGELTQGGDLVLTVSAKDAKPNTADAKTATVQVIDLPQVTDAKPTGDKITKKPTIEVTFTNAPTATAKLTLKQGEAMVVDNKDMTVTAGKAAYAITVDLVDGTYTATVVITRSDSKSVTYSWNFTVGEAQQKFYFGQLHSHTAEYSDGAGTLAQALNYIKNTAKNNNVQFVAFTDHSNYFDATGAGANAPESLYDASKMTAASKAKWDKYKGDIADFNTELQKNGILALGGFEMTWSGGPGHINTFNTPGLVSRNNTALNNKSGDAGMKLYYETLKNEALKESVSQFNHPGKTFGTFAEFAYWDRDIDKQITLVEVGNGEGAIGSGGYFPSYAEYTKALDKGWHVAPTNNQDNHKGNWGDANDARTVILSDSLSEADLYKAMRERKVYATEDKNLSINYTLNGNVLGSIIDKPEDNKVNIRAVISDPDTGNLGDKIATVEVIANGGKVVKTWNGSGHSGTFEVELPADYSYYYLRVTQEDKNIAVTAPVWVGKASVVGIGSFTTATTIPVIGEEITFTTNVFNSEEADATVKSIQYDLDGKVLDTQTPNDVIPAANGTKNYTFKFTPSKATDQTITVTMVMATSNGDRTYSAKILLEVLDPTKLVYVGVDGSHMNEYVAGNYYDSMGNFTKVAAGYGVRVVILNTSEELLAAVTNPKYKMLVLTAPSRRNGSVLREPYETYKPTEVAAIAAFGKTAGNTVVISGWADYYESYKAFPAEDHMAAQQNMLLAAIGSKLRVSDDEAKDETNSAGGPTKTASNYPRLYLSNFNQSHPFLDGVVYNGESVFDSTNVNEGKCNNTQIFSQYGGSSIYVVDGDGKASSTIPTSVNPMVYGYSTTFSSDDDKDNLGGTATPKYAAKEYDPATKTEKDISALMVMASENLVNGGRVIVSGGAFMSNFEIKPDLDNVTQLPYANLTILENILADLNQPEITAIADVQAAEEGQRFTIEGTLTSNVSGFDKDTAFFDCSYLQDSTGGINIFPISGNFKEGQKLRITGTTSSYQGERQLAIKSIKVLDQSINKIEPKLVSTMDIAQNKMLGQLIKIEGVIVSFAEVEGVIQTILVRDSSGGTARVFIDGYITSTKDTALRTNLKVGNKITVVGLASYDDNFNGPAPRIRIRDRDDVECKDEQAPIPPEVNPNPTPGGSSATPVVKPEDVKVGEKTVEVKLPSTGAKLNDAASEKLIAANADKPVHLTGGGLNVTIPAGTLSAGADVNAMLVNPKASGSVIKVTKSDGTTAILPIATVSGGQAAYVANIPGKYEVVDNTKTFPDASGHWALPAIGFVSARELFKGDSAGAFNPDQPMTRGMLATVLARIDGGRAASGTPFADVSAGSWYAKEIAWAAQNKLVEGDGKNFNPDSDLTREQLCVILARYLDYSGLTLSETKEMGEFSDLGKVSSWAKDAVEQAVKTGLISGKSGERLDPQGKATRAEIATILQRFVEGVLK